ncbi:hypothetical protein BDQ17DRAFT_1195526, partial [Cyathus striatus]
GAGVWQNHNNPENEAIRVPNELPQTNNSREAVGVLRSTQKTERARALETRTDSQVSITTLTTSRLTAENNDWIGYKNAKVTKATIAQIQMRKASTYLRKVKGHSGDEGNEEADHLANEGAIAEDDTFINVHIPCELRLSSVKLSTMTQSLAYQEIL